MRLAILLAPLLLIAACGGGADGGGVPGGGTSSCRAAFPDAGQPGLCIEVSGGTAQQHESNRQQCTAQGNTFAAEPCPRAGLAGGCRETATAAPGLVLTTWYYEAGGATAADIQMICEGLASVAPAGLTITFVLP